MKCKQCGLEGAASYVGGICGFCHRKDKQDLASQIEAALRSTKDQPRWEPYHLCGASDMWCYQKGWRAGRARLRKRIREILKEQS